jgi:hypothetical protein
MDEKARGITVEVGVKIVRIDEAIEKANQLKSLLQEVKEIAGSLNLELSVNGKPISENHQKDD